MKLTEAEAIVLDKILDATKLDSLFYLDANLRFHDLEEHRRVSVAYAVRAIQDGLAYNLSEPQSGGLSPAEIEIAENLFARARAAA